LVELSSGTQIIADLVLLSIGVRPDTLLAKDAGLSLAPSGHIQVNEYHQTSDPDVYAVGDCVITKDGVVDNQYIAAALAGPANRQARLVADHIYTPEQAMPYPGSLGTSILKCFDSAAGLTGWTEKRLKAAKIPYRVTLVSGFGHASYYPGAQQLTVKLCWCPDTHRLLGGQVSQTQKCDIALSCGSTHLLGV
jgi:NADPH-dependent 2,4-dienoyl-CoA reductase/sulfur reductase-like enzyme